MGLSGQKTSIHMDVFVHAVVEVALLQRSLKSEAKAGKQAL